MWNKTKEKYKASIIFLPYVLIADAIIYLLFLTLTDMLDIQRMELILCIFISNIFLLYKLGNRGRNEIRKIREAIKSIRLNEYKNQNEIKLGGSLSGLENEIQQLFAKGQNDLENMKKLEVARSEFLGNVSHELRTPIFAIQGYVETLLNGAVNDTKVNIGFLEKVNHHALNLSSLLNDLIDISMIESGQMKMSFRYFPIGEYLEGIINDFSQMAHEKGLEIVYKPVRSDLLLFGDKDRLRQVFVNLFTNAIKYTEKGKVELVVEEKEKTAQITVKDTGIGIPKEDLPRIFERFYRVDKVRSREIGGTGLGLAIVKHIIEAHGSKVTVDSIVGYGSEFSFRLKK